MLSLRTLDLNHHWGQFVGAAFQPRPSRQECRSHKDVEVAEIVIKPEH